MIRNLVKYPSRVRELQARFNAHPNLHGAENPTYTKGANDKAVNTAAATLRGWWNMSWGQGKAE
ncbi:hypothetical protein SPRG_13218 [Saprolegnia parasitica CBS 223.65]|uniref:Uncharacterized protein n=1 Tax=Saprolegnia parasitica (strain CBS 223.65) TaxID=695850 RepID=A0A067C3F1_SAPPC|nr:hypothetical protein SPRG_13218 [Saprolegnia parasitica CBS 223.65]KDO21327.1 hypothetical protein SPRG_13218 [Saprolegnia parasitica CBS 223.65]|eukprot:XP_012207982.1 hypothetical protein SPRG_13218 [Saprolegnia parasitica CBS 223.65]